jgi:SSS family solute:Na+ symporter/sodium/pantothenate symporter
MTWAWALFLIYAVGTAFIAWRGGRTIEGARSFAVGSGEMHPVIAGITLGACLASSATFVIMPGFVYQEGLPALIGLSLPTIAGIAVGFAVLAPRFQRFGGAALTVPHWLGARYASPGLQRLFAGLQVLLVAYLVLVTVGCAYVMQRTLGVPYPVAVVGIVLFVFGYTALGGAVAHAWTNTLQGAIMLVVALLVAAAGLEHAPRAVADLASTGFVAPGSVLFGSPVEVFVVPFVMGAALTAQPHLLSKALYVKGPGALRRTLTLGVGTYAVFCLVLLGGVWARFDLPAGVKQDQVMAMWLASAFPWEPVAAVCAIAILSASMSTLDGLLVAVSSSVANDLLGSAGADGAPKPPPVWVNRAVLVAIGAATIGLSLSPPELVLVFGQLGVYGLVVASVGPLLAAMMGGPEERLHPAPAFLSAIGALAAHFGVAAYVANPGLAAIAGLAVGIPLAVLLRRPVGAARPALAGAAKAGA